MGNQNQLSLVDINLRCSTYNVNASNLNLSVVLHGIDYPVTVFYWNL